MSQKSRYNKKLSATVTYLKVGDGRVFGNRLDCTTASSAEELVSRESGESGRNS